MGLWLSDMKTGEAYTGSLITNLSTGSWHSHVAIECQQIAGWLMDGPFIQ